MPVYNNRNNLMRFSVIFLLSTLMITRVVKAQDAKIQSAPVPVTVQLLSELLVERQLKAPAETISINHTQLSSELVGVVEKLHVDVGQSIAADEVLLELDPIDYELTFKQTQADLDSNAAKIEQAKLRLKRANDLSQSKFISADDLLARQTDLNVLNSQRLSLKIAVELAQRNINKTLVKAPFDGVVMNRYAQKGAYVSPGMVLIDFVQTTNPEVEANIPMHLASSLNLANQIVFDTGSKHYSINLVRLSPIIESGMRTQKARFSFVDQQAPIGASGELIWSISEGLLPADLVVSRNGALGVFSVVNDKARFIVLENAQEGRPVAIDLNKKTSIIVGGRERLQDGDRITR
jgi:RND family efflux transporter MFP subunit